MNRAAKDLEKLIYTAAHGGLAGQAAPLGGGATICDWLVEEWRRTRPFEVDLVGPGILGRDAPSGREITAFGERQYADFCGAFSRAATSRILAEDSGRCSVLVNDISEAPDFETVARAGFRIVTIYHVDVVDYIASIYLGGRVRAATLAQVWEKARAMLSPIAPEMLKLIFERQRDSLRYSRYVVVPSEWMKRVLLESYPGTPGERIAVAPWGVRRETVDESEVERETALMRTRFEFGPKARVIACLSRISPEKGQDLLLEGLIAMEREGAFRESAPEVLICGAPAYMRGPRHMACLARLAGKLRRVRVQFAGHVTGARKAAVWRIATVYAFPSRHESYGLTLGEALAEGLPSVAFGRAGGGEILTGGSGVLVEPGRGGAVRFAREAVKLIDDAGRAGQLGRQARLWAEAHPFAAAAKTIASLAG